MARCLWCVSCVSDDILFCLRRRPSGARSGPPPEHNTFLEGMCAPFRVNGAGWNQADESRSNEMFLQLLAHTQERRGRGRVLLKSGCPSWWTCVEEHGRREAVDSSH